MNVERLNVNIGGQPVPGYRGDEAVFRQLEARIGARLPAAYLDFIRTADGGHPEVDTCHPPGDDSNLFGVDWFYAFATPGVENINEVLDRWGKLLGARALPIGRDGGGNQFYLALDDAEPAVWIYLQDEDGARVKLADSFEGFVAGLILNPDFS